jgi:hypothetical protein
VVPAAGERAEGAKLLARVRDLERDLRELRLTLDRLSREARVREAALRVARARLHDRERELAAVRTPPAGATGAPAVEPTDGQGETATDYVRRLLDALADDPATALDDAIDWPGFVATMLAEGPEGSAVAGLEPAAALAALGSLTPAERETAFADARTLVNDLMGGPEGLAALKPRVGEHYRLGDTVRVELLAADADGAEQRFVLSVGRSGDRWRVVGLGRD